MTIGDSVSKSVSVAAKETGVVVYDKAKQFKDYLTTLKVKHEKSVADRRREEGVSKRRAEEVQREREEFERQIAANEEKLKAKAREALSLRMNAVKEGEKAVKERENEKAVQKAMKRETVMAKGEYARESLCSKELKKFDKLTRKEEMEWCCK
jgi:hypothetical protein